MSKVRKSAYTLKTGVQKGPKTFLVAPVLHELKATPKTGLIGIKIWSQDTVRDVYAISPMKSVLR